MSANKFLTDHIITSDRSQGFDIPPGSISTDSSQPVQNDIYEDLGHYITINDLIKFRFLVDDLLTNETISKMSEDNLTTGFKLRYLLTNEVQLRENNQELNLLIELLYITKKYNLLKKLQTCKHNVELLKSRTQFWFIQPFRRFLFVLCEELTLDDVEYLSKTFNYKNLNFTLAENLFSQLLKDNFVSKNNVEALQSIFHTMQRVDLIDKIDVYLKETKYYNLSPTIEGEPYGLAVIINQHNFNKNPTGIELPKRSGTLEDEESLIQLWKQKFGFDVLCKQDLTSWEILRFLTPFSQDRKYEKYKVFVCCIMSHGLEDRIYGADGVLVKLQDIYSLFAEKAVHFVGKPKLFFIQACQGDRIQFGLGGTYPDRSPITTDNPTSLTSTDVPLYADMLIGLSTVPGFVSYRENSVGSVYIQILTKILKANGHREDLNSLMTQVNDEVSKFKYGQEKQMCTVQNRLRRKLTFRLQEQ